MMLHLLPVATVAASSIMTQCHMLVRAKIESELSRTSKTIQMGTLRGNPNTKGKSIYNQQLMEDVHWIRYEIV